MQQDSMYYIHKDYLGSIEMVTNEHGIDIEKLSFDPWGRRRNATDWTYDNVPASFLFDRGYTGHEHLDNFDLINMNGRVYDPWLGRFLSPDPFVQAPTNTQNYNRYSYALNNPLKYVDPSGYTYGGPLDFKLGRGEFAPKGNQFNIGYRGYVDFGYEGSSNPATFMNSGFMRNVLHYLQDKTNVEAEKDDSDDKDSNDGDELLKADGDNVKEKNDNESEGDKNEDEEENDKKKDAAEGSRMNWDEWDNKILIYYKEEFKRGIKDNDSWQIINYGIKVLTHKNTLPVLGIIFVNTAVEGVMIIYGYPVSLPTTLPVNPYEPPFHNGGL